MHLWAKLLLILGWLVLKYYIKVVDSSLDKKVQNRTEQQFTALLDLRREKIVQAYATYQTSFGSPVNIFVIIYKSHAGQNPTFTTQNFLPGPFRGKFTNTKVAPW